MKTKLKKLADKLSQLVSDLDDQINELCEKDELTDSQKDRLSKLEDRREEIDSAWGTLDSVLTDW